MPRMERQSFIVYMDQPQEKCECHTMFCDGISSSALCILSIPTFIQISYLVVEVDLYSTLPLWIPEVWHVCSCGWQLLALRLNILTSGYFPCWLHMSSQTELALSTTKSCCLPFMHISCMAGSLAELSAVKCQHTAIPDLVEWHQVRMSFTWVMLCWNKMHCQLWRCLKFWRFGIEWHHC